MHAPRSVLFSSKFFTNESAIISAFSSSSKFVMFCFVFSAVFASVAANIIIPISIITKAIPASKVKIIPFSFSAPNECPGKWVVSLFFAAFKFF